MTSRLSIHVGLFLVVALIACAETKPATPGASDSARAGASGARPAGAVTKAANEDATKDDEATKGDDEATAVAPVVGARTAVVRTQPFVETMTAIGYVAPRPGRYAELSPPALTRVTHIYVAAGDAVAEGAALVDFDRAPFDAAAAGAAASLTVAQHAFERAQRLAAAGIVARKEVDQAAADLAQAQTTEITARRAQDLATLRAPLAGVVTHLSAVLGASVDPTQAVVGVADPSALDIVLAPSPGEGGRVRPADSVTVTAGQGTSGEPLGRGVIATVGVVLDTMSRTLAVRAHLRHPARALRIGETVSGRITIGVHPRALTVPLQALVPDGDGLKVFVLGPDGLAHARQVTVGGRTEALAEITAGVRAGETVVTEGAYGVEDSAKVVPVK